jgi:type IV secretory pathway component VirB8
MALLNLKLPPLRKKPAETAGSSTAAATTDRHASVREADPYSFQVAHRRLAWLLRISAGSNIALLFTVVVLANAISTMLPLKTTEIALVRSYDANDKIYRIEPIARNVYGFDVAMEGMAKRFVRECLEIDSVTQVERMRFCSRVSDAKYFERFSKDRRTEVEKEIKSGLTRSVMIETAERIEAVGNTYKYSVEYLQIDKRNGVLVEERKIRAYINITTRPHRVHPVDKYENPHGFTILDMSLKERANA